MIINPLEEITADISPIEFEQLCLNLLAETKNFNKIEDVKVEHNKIIEVNDGTYQLDGYIEYEFCGSIQKIIVECKKHKNSIKRDDVVILKEKLHSIGANKGILISTSGFQEGALKYAKGNKYFRDKIREEMKKAILDCKDWDQLLKNLT